MNPKKVVSFGETMMRLSTPSYKKIHQSTSFEINFGGSEMNVTASLANFGLEGIHVTVFPDNDIGLKALSCLKELGLETSFVKISGDRIGIYFFEKGASMRSSKIVYDRGNSAFQNLDPSCFDWKKILQDADWFHWSGITASLSHNAADACLQAVTTARSMGITVSADIFYRSGQWNYGKTPQDILPELAANSTVLLANAKNMEELLCVELSKTDSNFVDACQKTIRKYPCIQKVVDTNREHISSHHNKISAMLYDGENLHASAEMDIPFIVDRVGGGDAFLAGFIYAQLVDQSDLYSIDFGIAASALKHTIEGDVNFASVADVEALLKGDKSGRLKR